MELSNFAVDHSGSNSPFVGPRIDCCAGNQLVLTYVPTEVLRDRFGIPSDARVTLQEWNLVVDRNLNAFKPIIAAKYEADDWEVYKAPTGLSYPKLVITLEDMQRSGAEFSSKCSTSTRASASDLTECEPFWNMGKLQQPVAICSRCGKMTYRAEAI
jgi:hypothetical protein